MDGAHPVGAGDLVQKKKHDNDVFESATSISLAPFFRPFCQRHHGEASCIRVYKSPPKEKLEDVERGKNLATRKVRSAQTEEKRTDASSGYLRLPFFFFSLFFSMISKK